MYAPKQYRPEKRKPESKYLALDGHDVNGPIKAPPGSNKLEGKQDNLKQQGAKKEGTEAAQDGINKSQGHSEAVESSIWATGFDAKPKSPSSKRIGRAANPPQFKLGAEQAEKHGPESRPLQLKKTSGPSSFAASPTKNGMPEQVKAQMEGAFGTSFDDVKITANSSKAKEAGALAFAQGNNIHIAPGQYNPESKGGQELLGHELAHVVQQRQGRVRANAEVNGMPVNNDHALESEADQMGAKAAAFKGGAKGGVEKGASLGGGGAVQMKVDAGVVQMTPNPASKLPTVMEVMATFAKHRSNGLAKDKNGVNLRSLPETPEKSGRKSNIVRNIPFNETFTILGFSKIHSWYYVQTSKGEYGFVVQFLVSEVASKELGKQLYLIQQGDTGLGIASKFYGKATKTESNPDLRNYLEALLHFNNPKNEKGKGIFRNQAGEIHLKAGFNIWIPARSTAYAYTKNLPAGVRKGGTNIVESVAKGAYENMPFNQFVKAILAKIDGMPKEQAIVGGKIKEVLAGIKSFLQGAKNVSSWLSGLNKACRKFGLPNVTPEILNSLSRIAESFLIGFLNHLLYLPEERVFDLLTTHLRNITDFEFFKGYLVGMKDGVVGWGNDLWEMVKIVGKVAYYTSLPGMLQLTYSGELQAAFGKLQVVGQAVSTLANSMKDVPFEEILEGVQAGIEGMAENLGAQAASKLVALLGGTPFEQGHTMGTVVGYVLPDILLAVGTDGIGLLVKEVASGLRVVLNIVEEMLAGAGKVLKGIGLALGKLDEIAALCKRLVSGKATERFGRALEEFLEKMRSFLRKEGKLSSEFQLVESVDHKVPFGKGIQKQGFPFEDYLEKLKLLGSRLPAGFHKFDFWVKSEKRAISAKTIDTLTDAKKRNPKQIYYTLKKYIDQLVGFEGEIKFKEEVVTRSEIKFMELDIGIPAKTEKEGMNQIQRAIEYAKENDIEVKVFLLK